MKAFGWRVVLACVLALVGLATGWEILATGRLPPSAAASVPATPEMAHPELQSTPEVSAITSFNSPSPTCYRPVGGTGSCYVTWSYIQAIAGSSQYVISMTVTIDGRLRAYHSGFFQTAMYVPTDFYGPGFQVNCGLPAAEDSGGLGSSHGYVLRARDSSGHVATNSGLVQCPSDVVRRYLPSVRKP